MARRLEGLNPLAVLERGYAVVRRKDGSLIRSARAVGIGERVDVRVSDGRLEAEVVDVEESDVRTSR
jgi:exodeoxyribonuclease VII large subunit